MPNKNGYPPSRPCVAPMDWDEEVPRLARLARLDVSPAEARALAEACAGITRAFGDLAEYAAALPLAPEPAAGELREDVVEAAPAAEVEGILRAAPRLDPVTRAFLTRRGGA